MSFITTDDISKGVNWLEDWPLITAGTGCGKTSFMVNDLPQFLEEQTGKKIDSILLLEPLNMLKADVLRGYANTEAISHADFASNAWHSSRIGVCCFGSIASFLLDGNQIEKQFDLILIDEVDQLVKWSLCHKGNLLVWDWLEEQKENGSIVVSATATPSLLLDYVSKRSPFKFVDITPDFPVNLKSEQVTVVPNIKAQTFLRTVKPGPGNKYLVYIQSAQRCRELWEKYKGIGSGFVISKYQEKLDKDGKPLNEVMSFQEVKEKDNPDAEIPLCDYLTKYQELPQEVNILFINDAAVCGVNIKDEEVRHVIAETTSVDIAKQARGRIRHDLESFTYVFAAYCPEDEGEIDLYKKGGIVKRNPFYNAIKQYERDCFSSLGNKEYLAKAFAAETDNPIRFLDAEQVRQDGLNKAKAAAFDIPAVFNFEPGITEKVVSSKEIEQAAKVYPVLKKNGSPYGKSKWIESVNSETGFTIEKLSSRYHNGQKGTWYQVSNDQKQGGIF